VPHATGAGGALQIQRAVARERARIPAAHVALPFEGHIGPHHAGPDVLRNDLPNPHAAWFNARWQWDDCFCATGNPAVCNAAGYTNIVNNATSAAGIL
jgi:hypothetical protein